MTDLNKCPTCGAFLPSDAPAGQCGQCLLQLGLRAEPERESLPTTVAVAEKPGDWIGPYKLIAVLGEGGCGKVYLAEQEKPVRRQIALKVIKLGMDTAQFIARFEAERQALALMDHPNIAKVFDADATETGRPFFVMELVRGQPITDYCNRRQLSIKARLNLFHQVCQAIQHAHQKGIIHRDLKPSNVLVAETDSGTGVSPVRETETHGRDARATTNAVPKVIDFGIAKATGGQQLTDKTLFTAFEQFVGTPAYMSPEQAELGGADIDTRSDIYSLGVLLYELLTGKMPFEPQRLFDAGLDEIRCIIREEEPPRPSTRISTLNAVEKTIVAAQHQTEPPRLIYQIRGDLDWIVMKALEKDRARRYETANDLALDLLRHLNSEPVVARPPSNVYRFQKMVRRNKLAFAATTIVFATLVIALLISSWRFFKEQEARQLAVAAEHKAKTEALKSEQVSSLLKEMLKGVGPSVAAGRDTKMLREILDKTAERIGKDLKDQPEVEVELRDTLAATYFDLLELDKGVAMQRDTLRLQRTLHGKTNLFAATATHNLARILVNRGSTQDLVEGEALAREALAMRQQLLGAEHVQIADSLYVLGAFLHRGRQSGEAEQRFREAIAMRRKLLGNDHKDVAQALVNLGLLLTYQPGKLDEAEATVREAFAIHERLGLDTSGLNYPLGTVLEEQGKSVDAEEAARKAIASRRKLWGNENPYLPPALRLLAGSLSDQGKFDQAESAIDEALEIQRKLSGETHANIADYLHTQALIRLAANKGAEAESSARAVVAMRRKVYGNNHPTLCVSLVLLARTLNKLGQWNEAETALKESIVIREKAASDTWIQRDALFFPQIHLLLGEALLKQGKHDEAEPFLLSVQQRLKGRIEKKASDYYKQTLQDLVQLYELTQRPADATKWGNILAELASAK